MTDVVDELLNECMASHGISSHPEKLTEEELTRLGGDARWKALEEIKRLRMAAGPAWQAIGTAPKDKEPVLLFCPGLTGHVVDEVVVGAWRFDPNRRTLGYWVSDVGALDAGFAETGPWIEYAELHPTMWAPLPVPPSK